MEIKQSDNRPFIPIQIFGRTFCALVDTGSMVTIIGDRIAEHLDKSGIVHWNTEINVGLADSSSNMVNKVYDFHCIIGGRDSKIRALFLPGLTTPCILGMDLIWPLNLLNLLLNQPICSMKAISSHEPSIHANAVTPLTLDEDASLKAFLDTELPKFDQLPGRTTLVHHSIRLKTKNPIKQRYYPRNPAMQSIIDQEVDQMLTDDIIEKSSSPWSSPVVLIKKPSGKMRFCIDLRKVNEVSEKDAYPLPQIGAILDKLRNAQYISTIDLKNGYWQVPLETDSRPVTAFTIPGRGLYQFKVMPFGLHSAPATFQRLLDTIIGPEFEPYAFAYLDDLVLISSTFSDHLALLNEVFHRLRSAGLVINAEKCKFCQKELKYLGHVINEHGIQTDPDKVESIKSFPTPKCVKDVRSFLGLASWYRRFVENFARVSAPLTKLTKKNLRWEWTDSQETAFQTLKDKLTTTPVLACPDFNKQFVLQVDASNEGLGASLTQTIDKKERVIAYASRLLTDNERKFTTTEKECLALVWAVRKFRPYIEGYKFVAISDHQALKWLMGLDRPSGRLARWVLELQQHDFTIQYRKGTLNRVPDALSRYPVAPGPDYEKSCLPQSCAIEEETHMEDQNDPLEPQLNQWYTTLMGKVSASPSTHPDYLVKDRKLFKRFKQKGKLTDPTTEWKMCVPDELKIQVLLECHDKPTSGHFGINKTLNRIAHRYFWPKWRKETQDYVRSCDTCQRHKVEQRQAVGKMHFRRPRGPWYTVTSDIVGPLPRSRKGNRYIVVFQDTFSKWIELAPMKNATARQVAQRLSELILLRYGAPECILTDNGTQYVSHIFGKLTAEWGITHQVTAPYSPQSNPTERANRVIKTMISQFVKDDHRTWDDHLDDFRFALNTSVHDSTAFSPAMLMFCRELHAPNATHGPLFESSEQEPPTIGNKHSSRVKSLSALQQKCTENLQKAYSRQSRYYNLRRRDNNFKTNDLVLRKTHIKSAAADFIASKLAPKFEGPFKICGTDGANIFHLSNMAGKVVGRSHVKDLKPYSSPATL